MIADPPHLLKNTRNAWVKHKQFVMHQEFVDQYKLKTPYICLSVIEAVIDFQEGKELKIAPNLKREYINLKNSFVKMDVAPAKHVLSRETARAIRFVAKKKNMPPHFETAAVFCDVYGEFIDIATSRTSSISFNSYNLHERIAFLENFKRFFGSLQLCGAQDEGFWPVQRGTLLTCTSLINLSKRLIQNEEFVFFMGARVISDIVENLHSIMRNHCSNPTVTQYTRHSKIVSLTQYMKPIGKGSYEIDCPGDFLANLAEVKRLTKKNDSETSKEIEQDVSNFNSDNFEPTDDFYDQVTIAYLGGYILGHTIKTNSKCSECIEAFIADSSDDQSANSYIVMREYKEGCMVKPSKDANMMFQLSEAIFKEKRNELRERNANNVSNILRDLAVSEVSAYTFEKPIPKCHLKKILGRYMKARCIFWSNLDSAKVENQQEKEIETASFASKTARSHEMFTKKRQAGNQENNSQGTKKPRTKK